MSDYEKLTARDIDFEIAEKLMGHIVEQVSPGHTREYTGGHYERGQRCYQLLLRYTSDEYVRLVRDRIADMGLKLQYIDALTKLLGLSAADFHERSRRSAVWLISNATARQVCIAALQAIDGSTR